MATQIQTDSPTFQENNVTIARNKKAERKLHRYGDGWELRLSDRALARIAHYGGKWYYRIHFPLSDIHGDAVGPFPSRKSIVDALVEIQADMR